jgi:hypothetical protein
MKKENRGGVRTSLTKKINQNNNVCFVAYKPKEVQTTKNKQNESRR